VSQDTYISPSINLYPYTYSHHFLLLEFSYSFLFIVSIKPLQKNFLRYYRIFLRLSFAEEDETMEWLYGPL